MATTVSRIPLSGSTHGRGVKVAATSSAGTTIHTATSGLTLLVPDLVLRNSLIVKAYAGTTNVVTIHGFVNRVATA